jgi:hypothetical protein
LGGDPLYDTNIDFTRELVNKSYKDYDFCIYTGYDIDFVIQSNITDFKFIKCGRYMESLAQVSKKTHEHMVLASSNQALYDEKYNLISKNGVLHFKE